MVERVEVGHPGAFEDCNSMADIADGFLSSYLSGEPVCITEEDRQGLTELIEQHLAEVMEYIAAIRARPVAGRLQNPAAIRDRENWERRRRLTNAG
jgi:hypothetical protein